MVLRGINYVVFVLFCVASFFTINFFLKYIVVPENIMSFSDIIFLVIGVLLLYGGIEHLRVARNRISGMGL